MTPYIDFIRERLSLNFKTKLHKPLKKEDGGYTLMNIKMGICPKLDVSIEEMEVNSISVEYRINFLEYSTTKRIYFPDNLSPRECSNKYYSTISYTVSKYLFDNHFKILEELLKNSLINIQKIKNINFL